MAAKITIKDMQLVPVDKLVPYVNNARTHSPEQVTKLRSSLREFGFINPVIIDDDYSVLAGHGRLLAAKAEGFIEVPCVFAGNLTEAQKKAYILADNRYAQDAGWDEELLRVEIESLQGMDFDIALTGFEEAEIADLFDDRDADAKEDEFDVEKELEKPAFSHEGDIWHLGRHTVICGDSTLPDTYARLLGDRKVNLVCTDPPYLVALDSSVGKIKNDDLDDAAGYEFLRQAFEQFHEAMAKDASIYVFYATAKARVFHDAYEDAGFKVGAGLVWKKDRLVLTRTDWKYIHEPIIWGWRKDGKHIWYGDQKQKTVFEFDRIKNAPEFSSDARRGSAAFRGYDHKWQIARRRYLKSNPLCAVCMKEGRLEPATVVDHIIPHRGDQKLFWDEENWQPLCKSCHDRKTGSGF